MENYRGVLIVLAICFLAFLQGDAGTRKKSALQLPRARLLVGFPPANLRLITPDEVLQLQDGGRESLVFPSISANGQVVASAIGVEGGEGTIANGLVAIAAYSISERKWTQYSRIRFSGGVAVAPDGGRLAYALREESAASVRLHIIDLETGAMTTGPILGSYDGIKLSWSPDGHKIVFEMFQSLPSEGPQHAPAILVVDLATGKITKLADGSAPSWAPSGEWIAYLDHSGDTDDLRQPWKNPNPNRVVLVRPDGTRRKVVYSLPNSGFLQAVPVWSPDSRKLLLNESFDMNKGTVTARLLTLSTGRVMKIAHDVPPIYGWAVSP